MKNFMILNIINFTDMTRRDKILWDVREFHHHKTYLARLASSRLPGLDNSAIKLCIATGCHRILNYLIQTPTAGEKRTSLCSLRLLTTVVSKRPKQSRLGPFCLLVRQTF